MKVKRAIPPKEWRRVDKFSRPPKPEIMAVIDELESYPIGTVIQIELTEQEKTKRRASIKQQIKRAAFTLHGKEVEFEARSGYLGVWYKA